jgi:rod shape-determining protein MreB
VRAAAWRGRRAQFSNDLSIDLGTANTLIYVRGQGIVLNEPSVVAIRTTAAAAARSVAAVGAEAKNMLGRTPGHITAIRPMKDGVIADFTVTEKMLQHFIRKVHGNRYFRPSPRVLVCVPCGSTQVERRAIRESAEGAGAREVFLSRNRWRRRRRRHAGARGARLDGARHRRRHLRGGGDLAERHRLRELGAHRRRPLRRGDHQLRAPQLRHPDRRGHRRAHQDRDRLAPTPADEVKEISVKGRNLSEGVPRSFTLNSNEILEALQEPLQGIVSAVKQALEQTPPELGADVAERGIVLTGGGALLRDIDKLLMEETGLPVVDRRRSADLRRARRRPGAGTHLRVRSATHVAYSGNTSGSLFAEGGAGTLRLMLHLTAALILMVADYRGGYLERVRYWAGLLAGPAYLVAASPVRLAGYLHDTFSTRDRLANENHALSQQLMMSEARVHRLEAVQGENQRLRALLGGTRGLRLSVQLASLIDIDLDPFRHRIVLDAGSRRGVREGLAVIDGSGVVGQIVAVTPLTATAMLVSDPSHAVPVQVVRSGLRTIAYGTGPHRRLVLAQHPAQRRRTGG